MNLIAEGTSAMMLGAGGHSRALAAAFGRAVDLSVHPGGDTDDDRAIELDPEDWLVLNGVGFVGGAPIRAAVFERYRKRGFRFASIAHPRSAIDDDVRLGMGAQIMIGASVVSGATISENTIINSGAVVDHDCVVGEHSHIAPGAVLCGDVIVGTGSFVGAGAVVLPGIRIGDNAIVGAGAVVRRQVESGTTVVGVPAKPIREQTSR